MKWYNIQSTQTRTVLWVWFSMKSQANATNRLTCPIANSSSNIDDKLNLRDNCIIIQKRVFTCFF